MSSSPLLELWSTGILRACWQGGLLVLLVWAAARTVLKRFPVARQALWWLVCAKVLIGAFWLQPIRLEVLPRTAPMVATATQHAAGAVAGAHVSTSVAQESVALPWGLILVAVWLAGVAVKLGYLAWRGLKARRTVQAASRDVPEGLLADLRELAIRQGLAHAPGLALSDQVSAPCVAGLLRPTVLLPRDFEARFSPDEQTMALSHELAHVKRWDLWLSIVPTATDALFWFFPPVWLAVREWLTERESACDREAVRATGAAPKRYGEMLLKLARTDLGPVAPGLGATAQFHTLRRRLASVFEAAPASRVPAVVSGLGGLLLVPWSLAAPGPAWPANADMEQGSGSPAAWRAEVPAGFEAAWDSSVAHSGSHSLRMSRSTNRFWPIGQWIQEVPYDGRSGSLEFGAWLRAAEVRKAVLDVQFESTSGERSHSWCAFVGELDEGYGPANHDWAPYAGVVTIPPGTRRVWVALQQYGPGTIWMDDAFVSFTGTGVAK